MSEIDVKALTEDLRGSFPLEVTEAAAKLHDVCLDLTTDEVQAYMAQMALIGFGYLCPDNIEAAGKLLAFMRQHYVDALEKQQ